MDGIKKTISGLFAAAGALALAGGSIALVPAFSKITLSTDPLREWSHIRVAADEEEARLAEVLMPEAKIPELPPVKTVAAQARPHRKLLAAHRPKKDVIHLSVAAPVERKGS